MAGTRLLSQITFSTGILALLCGISLVCINFESSLTDSVTLLMKIVSDTNNKINSSSYYDILVSRDICNDCTVFISLHNAEIEHQDEYQRKSLFICPMIYKLPFLRCITKCYPFLWNHIIVCKNSFFYSGECILS